MIANAGGYVTGITMMLRCLQYIVVALLLWLPPASLHAAAATPAAKPTASRTPASPAAKPAEAAPAAAEPAAPRPLAVDVRNATLSSVVAQMASVAETHLRVDADLGDERVTLYAGRTNPEEFQRALATLFGYRWVTEGGGEDPARLLTRNPEFTTRVLALERRQWSHFLRRLRETGTSIASGSETDTVQQVREDLQRRQPEIDDATLKDVSVDFLRQALLISPVTGSLQDQLVRVGWASVPFHWLGAADQRLLASFASNGGLREPLGREPGAGDVSLPNSRVTYRLIYGDRWTDTLLWVQVGAPGDWATAILPSILFREEDGAAAYPQVKQPPNDPDVWQRTPGRFDVKDKSWNQILAELGAAMNLKIASDSYLRPPLFEPQVPRHSIAGVPLRLALDLLARDHGMFWWKEDGWYYFRSRTWPEESRVAVPDRLLVGWTNDIRQTGRLSAADLDQMGSLSEEQLLTLGLMANSRKSSAPRLAAFDPTKASLVATSLLLFRSLTPVQREQALSGDGLPAMWMSPAQQYLYTAVAADHGYVLEPEEAASWGFALEQAWNAPPATQPVNGRVRMRWSFGPGLEETADMGLSDALLLEQEKKKPGKAEKTVKS
jgi:hypothetical protein